MVTNKLFNKSNSEKEKKNSVIPLTIIVHIAYIYVNYTHYGNVNYKEIKKKHFHYNFFVQLNFKYARLGQYRQRNL